NCGEKGDCRDGHHCLTHDLWMGLNEKIYEYLAQISLQTLLDNHANNNSQAGLSPIKLSKSAGKTLAM
ncbi:MAG: hypothetical protein ABL915_00700, partial [Gallionella sp.]